MGLIFTLRLNIHIEGLSKLLKTNWVAWKNLGFFFLCYPKMGTSGGFLRTFFQDAGKVLGSLGILWCLLISADYKGSKNLNSAQNSALWKNSDAGKCFGQF
jgi:hypothetical protein